MSRDVWDALALLLSSVVLASGGGPASAGAVTNWHPAWSPDGKWIAFARKTSGRSDIWIADGVHTRRIVRGGDEPDWSPDGKRIAFTGINGDVRLVSASGGAVRAITHEHRGMEPAWAPNGRLLAYSGLPDNPNCTDGWGIYLMRPDGTHREMLVVGTEFGGYWTPDWSSDGQRLAFISSGEQEGVWVGPVHTDRWNVIGPARAWHPSWSPDGRRIAFSVDDVTAPGSYNQGNKAFGPMYVIDAATRKLTRLTQIRGNGPAWSPGGKRIAFSAAGPSGYDIYLVNPDGSHLLRLTKR